MPAHSGVCNVTGAYPITLSVFDSVRCFEAAAVERTGDVLVLPSFAGRSGGFEAQGWKDAY